MQPNPALTAFDEVVVVFILFVDEGQVLTQVDDVFVLLHPIAEEGKFIYDLVLYFVDGHCPLFVVCCLLFVVCCLLLVPFGLLRVKLVIGVPEDNEQLSTTNSRYYPSIATALFTPSTNRSISDLLL